MEHYKEIIFVYDYETPNGPLFYGYDILDLPNIFLDNLKKKEISTIDRYLDYYDYKKTEIHSFLINSLIDYSKKYQSSKNKNPVIKFKNINSIDFNTNDSLYIYLIESGYDVFQKQIIEETIKLSDISGSAKYHLKNSNNFFLWFIDVREGSYIIDELLFKKINDFIEYNSIPENKIWFSNGNNFLQKVTPDYFKGKTSPINYYITIGSNLSNIDFHKNLLQAPTKNDLDISVNRNFKFLSYNRNSSRLHRPYIISKLWENDILKNSIVSLYENESYEKYINDEILEDHDFEGLKFNGEDVSRLKKFTKESYPLKLDHSNQHSAAIADNYLSDKTHFLDTYISLVCETSCSSELNFITEKCIRPMLGLHPFIVFGNPHTLKILKQYGFKTFDSFIDESYDEEFDTNKRFEMAYGEVLKLNKLKIDELHEIYYGITTILKYNQKLCVDLHCNNGFVHEIIKTIENNLL